MKCPNCKTDINLSVEQSEYCPNCHYNFSEDIKEKLEIYKQIKSSIRRLDLMRQNFSENLEVLQMQADSLEKSFNKDFEKVEVAESYIKPEPVVATNSEIQSPQVEEIKKVKPPKKTIHWEMLFGFNGFLILGVISVVIGVGFFIRKAFVSGLLGPVGKVSIIYLAAIISLGIGNFFRKKRYPEFGQGLIGMGIALLYYSTYSAFHNYELFNQFVAFFLMILITTFAVFIAVLDNNKWLAVLGLIGGFSTPIMLDSGSSQNIALYSYITILNSGLLAIAFYKKWNILNNLGFISTYLIFGFTFKTNEFWTSVIFLNIYFFVYSLVPFAYHLFKEKKENLTNTALIFLNSFVALGFNYDLITAKNYPIEYLSIITLLYSVNFIAMASYIYKQGRKEEQSFIFTIAQASLLLSITVPIIFSKEVITLFWSAEAAILMWVSNKVNSRKLVIASTVMLSIALGKFFFVDYDDNFSVIHMQHINPDYTFKIMPRYIVSIFLLASFYKLIDIFKNMGNISYKNEGLTAFYSVFVLSLFTVLNVEVSAFFYSNYPNGRFVALSILWAIFAISMMYAGLRFNVKTVRQAATGLFGLTLIKVFFFDIAELSISYKFISFIVLGIILIFTSYMYRTFKDQIVSHIQEPDKDGEKV